MNWLDWIKLIMQFFPVVLQVITGIEAALPTASGTAKKSLAMVAINPPTASVAAVSGLVDTVVTNLNSTGIFTKGAVAPVVAPATPTAK